MDPATDSPYNDARPTTFSAWSNSMISCREMPLRAAATLHQLSHTPPNGRNMHWIGLGCLAILLGCFRTAMAEEPLFPFVVSYDAPASVSNVSGWLQRPAGGQGFLREVNGHLATDAGPIRLWATNLCFNGCFPTQENALRVAARIASLGINCVRLHHMDSHSIWGKSPNKLTIDSDQLARLDYLIYQLKQHGVYVDINLHVSRWFDKAEGFGGRTERPHYDKGLDNFEPRMLDLQKKYARDLLTHVNPHTKTAYTDEPAVACVEINNENALFSTWNNGELDELPDPYAATFRGLWNAWLRKKYGDTAHVRQVWNVGDQPLGGEMLTNGDFSRPFGTPWSLERDDQTVCDATVRPDGPDGRPCLELVVKRSGRESWRPQLVQGNFPVAKGNPYTLTFSLRSDQPRSMHVNCMQNHAPWRHLGCSAAVKVGPKWKQYRFTFVASETDAKMRISFSGFVPGTHALSGVSLRPGGIVGLSANERLEDDGVQVVRRREMSVTPPVRNDFIDFLWDTENAYWPAMHRFLKEELKVRPLVIGTQLGYSPVHIQAKLDFLDNHAYWQHPHFPGKPWDMNNWTVRNTALVNSPGGTLTSLAARRVAGRAYTITEYNHPQPNQYAAEGFVMAAAFGAFQRWDGIFSFAYSHNEHYEPKRIESFFDIKGETPKLVHMPACVAMFLRGDVAPAKELLTAVLSPEAERNMLRESLNAWSLTTDRFGLESRQSLLHAIALDVKNTSAATPAVPPLAKEANRFVSDTGELCWDLTRPGAGYFTVNTARTKLFTGFVAGRTFELGNVRLAIGPTQLDWATVSMVCLEGPGFDRPGRILVAASGLAQNQGAKLERRGRENVTLGRQWGSEPVMCEGVPLRVTLPVTAARVKVFPLDPSGGRQVAIPATDVGGKAEIALEPKYRTLWYEIELAGP